MNQGREGIGVDRIATDLCALPDEMLDCLKSLAARSASPIAISVERGRALQLHGRFKTDGTTKAHFEFARDVLACLSGKSELTLEPCKKRDKHITTDGESIQFEIKFHGIPVYRSGVSLVINADGMIISVTVVIPRTSPTLAKWEHEDVAKRTLRKIWGLDDVGAQWPLYNGQQMWYSTSLVHGTIDDETWQPAWVFYSKDDVANPFDVIVSSDGSTVIDTFVIGDGTSLTPIPRYHIRAETGVPDFITWGQTGLLLPEATTGDPQRVARALFDRYPKLFGTWDSTRQLAFVRTDVSTGSPHTRHLVFQQIFGSIPVYGCLIRVHLSPTLAIRSVTGNYLRDPQVSLDTPVSEQHAMNLLRLVSSTGDDNQTIMPNDMNSHGLVIFPAVLAPAGGAINYLVWWILTPYYHYFISAESGRIVYRINARQGDRLVYDANQMLSGEVLDLRNSLIVAPGGTPDMDSVSVDKSIESYENFLFLFGWLSWAGTHVNDETGIVDCPDPTSWHPYSHHAKFQRNFTTSEIIGHEFTHGVVQSSCDLQYIGESGALNEAFADIFGKLAFPGSPVNWLIRNNDKTIIRDLKTPSNVKRPFEPTPPSKYSQMTNIPNDDLGVHSNSLIGGHCAVLICDGIPGQVGIGRELTSRLFWDVMTLHMHPWATYLDFSHAMSDTVRNLASLGTRGVAVPASSATGGGPMPIFGMASVIHVEWALDQVELSPALHSGWFTIPGIHAETRTFMSGGLVDVNEVVTDAELLITRRRDADKIQFLFGRAIAPSNRLFVDQSGTITVFINSDGVGTRNKEFTADITNTGGVSFDIEANIYKKTVSPPKPSVPPDAEFRYPTISHWFDNPFFLGRKYGDLIYETVGLSTPSCTILDVWVELLEYKNGMIIHHGETRVGEPGIEFGGAGVTLVEAHPGTSELEAKVRSWHVFGQLVRYRIVYKISGGCIPTSFGYRDVDPFTFK